VRHIVLYLLEIEAILLNDEHFSAERFFLAGYWNVDPQAVSRNRRLE